MSDYWTICAEEALEEANLPASPEQINTLASYIKSAHEHFGQAHGYDQMHRGPDPEIERLKRDLETERNKVICGLCKGSGILVSHGPHHSSRSHCYRCRGDGRHSL